MNKRFSLGRWMPGLMTLLGYQRAWLMADVRAGVSVAAVGLPVAIAYAELTGVGAEAGLYSSILPMIAYAIFGSSRQLIVGPDAATCAVIAAVVTPLALGDPTRHWQLVMTMTAMTGVWCLIASRLRLGVLADFLSSPILMGLLNGVAITIIVGQLSSVFGFTYHEQGLVERVLAAPNYVSEVHLITLGFSLLTLLVMLVGKRLNPLWPTSLLALAVTATVLWALGARVQDVAVIGTLSGRFPDFQIPEFPPGLIRELVLPALNLAMISFVSLMLTARSFAARNGYDIDADAEFRALGIANIASAVSQGFAVSGAGSRTAVNDANGGKTQMVSLVAALATAAVTFYLYSPLQYIPTAALGVILILASLSMTDFRSIWALRHSDSSAFWLAWVTFFSVLLVGVIPGIALAVLLGLFQFLRNVMRPTEQLMGMNDEGVVHTLGHNEEVKAITGVLIYRFNSPLTYFNAAYFKRRVLVLLASEKKPAKCLIIDAVSCFTHQDISVMTMVGELHKELKRSGIHMVMAGRRGQMTLWLKQAGIRVGEEGILVYPDVYQALRMTSCYWDEEPETITLESEANDIAEDERLQALAQLELSVLSPSARESQLAEREAATEISEPVAELSLPPSFLQTNLLQTNFLQTNKLQPRVLEKSMQPQPEVAPLLDLKLGSKERKQYAQERSQAALNVHLETGVTQATSGAAQAELKFPLLEPKAGESIIQLEAHMNDATRTGSRFDLGAKK
ncbi:sodium-independent anion transporter [Oceanisphaera profunda]|uniref:Sodium-independent anion transporter n=1 Tax=Oceanisphaera profunda TaxID=1416627 RepID=A0A1Y0D3Q8_9GAMM|nr:sodium-independent anion transporter [Oceanisphaera profunda]